jgi:hypothetical protein
MLRLQEDDSPDWQEIPAGEKDPWKFAPVS